jgi:hypothetical protein
LILAEFSKVFKRNLGFSVSEFEQRKEGGRQKRKEGERDDGRREGGREGGRKEGHPQDTVISC